MKPLTKNLLCLAISLTNINADTLIQGDPNGNTRGQNAIDIQTFRVNASQVASGWGAIVIGRQNTSSGNNSFTFGLNNTAVGNESLAIGHWNYTAGPTSYAFGYNNQVNANISGNGFAAGQENSVIGDYGIAVGSYNLAAAESVVFGFLNEVHGLGYAFGFNNYIYGGNPSAAPSGDYQPSGVFGYNNTVGVGADGSFIYGQGNTVTVNTDRATIFGSGINNSTSDSTMIGPSDAAKVTILSSGNVGIGTTAPTSKLTVVGDLNVTGTIINPVAATTGSGSTARLRVGGTINPPTTWQGTAVIGADGQNKLIAGYLGSATSGATIGAHNSTLSAWADLNVTGSNVILRTSETERMRISSTGNVGIGVTNPAALLDIRTSAGTGTTTELLRLVPGGGTNANGTASRIAGYSDIINGYIDIKRFASAGPETGITFGTFGGDALTIRSGGSGDTGKVGIGTTAPTSLLDVYGSSPVLKVRQNPAVAGSATVEITAAGTASDSNAATLKLHTASALWGRTDGAGLRIGTADKTATWATFDNSGNLGLGVAPVADARINVVGNAKVSGTLTVGGSSVLTTAGGTGANLTSLNASNISSGSLPAARLPAEAVQLSSTQTLTNKTLSDPQLTGNINVSGNLNVSGSTSLNDTNVILFPPNAGVIMRNGSSELKIGRSYPFSFDNTLTMAAATINIDAPNIKIGSDPYGSYQSSTANVTIQPGSAGAMLVQGKTRLSGDVTVKNRAVIRVSAAGDIGMGSFTSGTDPEL